MATDKQSPAIERTIYKLAEKLGNDPGNLITLLQEIQLREKYLSPEALNTVAQALKISVSQVYGVATFYSQFKLTPPGEHSIKICHGTACHVAGAENITRAIERKLGAEVGTNTADGLYTLEKVACVGCCSLAPVVMVDQDTYGRLDEKGAEKLFESSAKSSADNSTGE